MSDHIHHTLPFLINRIAATVSAWVNQQFLSLGLNVYSARVLILLHLDGEHSVGHLALQSSLEQSTLSHILIRLEKQGLVKRTRQPSDNRSVLVTLTSEGQVLAKQCWKAVKSHDSMLREGLASADAQNLVKLLNRTYKNVHLFKADEIQTSSVVTRSAVSKKKRNTKQSTTP
jgi:MarR family transcriptional regulator, organic hydroperoxide resistance regulator